MDSYRENLTAIKERFPFKRYLSQKQMCEYLGIGDRRTLRRRYGIERGCTAETFRKLISGAKK